MPAGDRVLLTKRDARVKRAGGEGTRAKISGNSTHIFFGVAGERASWLGTLPVPVMGNLGGALWAGGGGSRGPAIAVSRAASAVGGARTAAQWRVLEQLTGPKRETMNRFSGDAFKRIHDSKC